MYKYAPPKSSVWGHSLQKMKPGKQKTLVDEFINKSVSEFQFNNSSVIYQRTLDTVFDDDLANKSTKIFEDLISASSSDVVDLSNLTEEHFKLCLKELQSNSSHFISGKSGIILKYGMKISKWLIDNKEVPTESIFIVSYGAKPWVTTFFTFSEIDHFHFVKKSLDELGICKLNQKHLKRHRKKS